jgi:hypothetical protein
MKNINEQETENQKEIYVAQTYEQIIKEYLDEIYKSDLDRLVEKLFG